MAEEYQSILLVYGVNMKFCNLASGSAGNCSYIETKNFKILIDLGKTKKYIVDGLKDIGVDYKDIDYVFLTHTHDDHIAAINTFLHNHKASLVVSNDMFKQLNSITQVDHIIVYDDNPNIENLDIKTYKMSHDAGDTRAFLITEDDASLVYITDTGYINQKYFKELSGKKLYYIESNHDIEMLTHGPYPKWLQARVLSDLGHLSNKFTGMYLSKFISDNTSYVCLAHLSQKNNTEDMALTTVAHELRDNDTSHIKITCCKESQRGDVITI